MKEITLSRHAMVRAEERCIGIDVLGELRSAKKIDRNSAVNYFPRDKYTDKNIRFMSSENLIFIVDMSVLTVITVIPTMWTKLGRKTVAKNIKKKKLSGKCRRDYVMAKQSIMENEI